jgi:cell wall-associated NlpC family hydrolase
MVSRTSLVAVSFATLLPLPAVASDAVDLAARLINHPYVWGAEGPDSFDCSGLTQYVYQDVGIELPRRAISQSQVGVPAGRQLQRGDLVFFSTDAGSSEVTHVGIYEGRGVMIDASKRYGRVRRDDLGDPFWTDRFLFARRVTSLLASSRTGRSDPSERPRSSPRIDRRAVAAAIVEGIAGAILRRPRR